MSFDPSRISQNVKSLALSGTVEVSDKVREMKRKGIDIIHFGSGDPDFDTPAHIREAAEKALRDGLTHYVESRGILELREAISEKLARENGITADPGSEIIVTPGGKHAVFCSILTLCNPGDEVIILDPSYVSYEPCVQIAGAHPVKVPLKEERHFRVTSEEIEKIITPRSKGIIVNSPNNPTGAVFEEKEIRAIASIAQKHDLFVISDEVYETLIFDGKRNLSIGSLPGMAERTITVNAFSKTYAMTGWRLGYFAGPKPIMSEAFKVYQHSMTCAPSFIQKAGVAALRGPQEPVRQMAAEFERRRNILAQEFAKIPGLTFVEPEGTFYIFPNISFTRLGSVDFAHFLLEAGRVAVTPGIGFGEAFDGYVRIAFTRKEDQIREALRRMKEALNKLPKT
jgi:aspartate aminotransferase